MNDQFDERMPGMKHAIETGKIKRLKGIKKDKKGERDNELSEEALNSIPSKDEISLE